MKGSGLYKLGLLLALVAGLLVNSVAATQRVKDLASIAGVRDNQLLGYGLVVGLNDTGDGQNAAPFMVQSLKSMLNRYGITLPPNVDPNPSNVAAVSVHAKLPPFSKPGQTIDVTVSSIGDAESLRGGSLLMTPLKGADGQVYAIAQGNLVVGGFGAQGEDGSQITVNVPSVGRIPNGATVEREVRSAFDQGSHLTINLNQPDFTTAKRLVKQINEVLGSATAHALDAGSVRVRAPMDPNQRVSFISLIENLEIQAARAPARVVFNARTGTVVMGSGVEVSPAAITHGSLVVTIQEDPETEQPAPLSQGETATVENSEIGIEQEENPMFLLDPGVTLDEIVRAVNQVGAAPGDLQAILEALKQAGALHAELIVI